MPEAKPAETPPAQPQDKGPGARVEPYRAYNFNLIIEGVGEGHFTSCSGLGFKVTPIRYREGGSAQVVHQLAGPVEYSEVTLRYGLTDSMALWDWLLASLAGTPDRKHVSLAMLGPGGTGERMRWDLIDAWPCEWRGAPLDALGREIAIETLTLVYEGIERR